MQPIILGRNETDLKKYGEIATIPLGKHYITMERDKSLANPILLDINKPHAVLICGKRGSGKSYSLGVVAEGLANLNTDIKQNISTVIFDTMGIYWTMKHANYREEKNIHAWQLKPQALRPKIFIPLGMEEEYRKKRIPFDFLLSLSATDLEARDWCHLFKIDFNSIAGILIERAILAIKKPKFSIEDIIKNVQNDDRTTDTEKNLVIARFEAVEKWSLFSDKPTNFNQIISGGATAVIDISAYNFVEDGQEIKELVIGLFSKKILKTRLLARKEEEVIEIEQDMTKLKKSKAPLIWIMIDEAHEFLPREGETYASAPLIQLLREGRQPGISLILATQQPGKIHTDVITQSDIVLAHRLTAKLDINALNDIMQSYLSFDVVKYIDNLPRVKGAAIVLDDNSEKIYPMQVQPRISWHGGEDPQVIRTAMKKFLSIK
jgi:uncharacterized protein